MMIPIRRIDVLRKLYGYYHESNYPCCRSGQPLLPLTEDVPKCLVQVNEVSILERELDALHRNFITEVILISAIERKKFWEKLDVHIKVLKSL
jgi:2-C-methyl-D-erythritol 4-phosphate cytidylyltransferase